MTHWNLRLARHFKLWVQDGRRGLSGRTVAPDGSARLNALTLAFIEDARTEGERALRLFRAAGNFGEFDCPAALALALLTEAALESGLAPSETLYSRARRGRLPG